MVLNRPEAANVLDIDLCRALSETAIQCDEDPDVRAVHLTGAGRMFCAGGDLRAFEASQGTVNITLKRMTTYLHSAMSRFARMRAPLVVAVNGPAAGAGFPLALLGDLVFCAKSASFVTAYAAAGLSPDGGSTYLLPRMVGMRRAQELVFTKRRLSADEAQNWGVVTKVLADAELATGIACRGTGAGRWPDGSVWRRARFISN